jgi:hypothetical protein
VIYYPFQWKSKGARKLPERPTLHLLTRSDASRKSIILCIERCAEDLLMLDGVEIPVGETFARVRTKYNLGDEHYLPQTAGLICSGNAPTSYSRKKLTDITLTHSKVASPDYLVLCSIFADYLGAGTWFQIKEGSDIKTVGGRRVQEEVVRLTSGGDDGNAMLL